MTWRLLLLSLLALNWLAQAAPAEPKPACRHILLMDISGSLRTRGYATRQGWTPVLPEFWAKLLAADDLLSPATDDVVFCPFSDGATDAKEGRHPVGPFPISEFKGHVAELPFPGGGATDMPRALDMGRQLCSQASPKRSLVWLITDNENNLQGLGDDEEFYRRLRDSDDYSHVMFFPLAEPKVRPNDNVVMYLLVPKGQWDTSEVEKIAQAVTQKTGYDGILFRPLYTAPGLSALDFSKELSVEARGKHPVTQEGGTTVLHFQEGEKLEGRLKFRIRSRLKGWKLNKAHLEDAAVTLDIPSTYSRKGSQKTTWLVTPKELTVEPQKETAEFFLLQLGGPEGKPLVLTRSTTEQLTQPFLTHLPEIHGKVTMKARVDLSADGIKTEIPPAMHEKLATVPNLADIEHFMVLQSDMAGTDPSKTQREIQWERQLVVRVEADSMPALLLAGLVGVAVLIALALAAAALLMKQRVQLEGPSLEEEISLPYLAGSYLVCDSQGKALFTLRSRLGGLSMVACPECSFNEHMRLLSVRWEGNEFRFEFGEDGKPTSVFWLRRQGRDQSGDASAGGSVL